MAEIHDQLAAEGIVKEAQGSMIKGRLAVYGRLYLTSTRLVYLQSNRALSAFGALGALAMGLLKPKKLVVDIPLNSITGVTRGKYGPNKNILEVSHSGGDPVKFAVRYDEWEQALQGAGVGASSATRFNAAVCEALRSARRRARPAAPARACRA
jgi:hypothetical protein